MKPEEKVERGRLTEEMMATPWFKKYFEPEVQRKIDEARDIKKINDKDIENSYRKQVQLADVWGGIINVLKGWVADGNRSKDFTKKEDKK